MSKNIKEELFNEFLGFGKKAKEAQERIQKANEELRAGAKQYYSKFKSAKVGPFILPYSADRDPRYGTFYPNHKFDKQIMSQKQPDDVHQSIIEQQKMLMDILTKWEKATGKRRDDDKIAQDVGNLSRAVSAANLYVDYWNKKAAAVTKEGHVRITNKQLRRIIQEEIAVHLSKTQENL